MRNSFLFLCAIVWIAESLHHHLNLSTIFEFEKLAESYYWEQRDERICKIAEDFKKIGANYPCIFGEIPLGGADAAGIFDGHKYTCGIHYITGPPIVYSFGSCKDQAFELALLRFRPDAQIHIFEIDPNMLPDYRHPNISYNAVGLGGWDSGSLQQTNFDKKLKTMKQVMSELHHNYVDVVKMDIEGFEFLWLRHEAALASRIGQLLIEVHTHTDLANKYYPGEDAVSLVTKLEEYGLRVFHQEINRHAPLWGSEMALIQAQWSVFEEKKTFFTPV